MALICMLDGMNPPTQSTIRPTIQALNCFASLLSMGMPRRMAARIALAYLSV